MSEAPEASDTTGLGEAEPRPAAPWRWTLAALLVFAVGVVTAYAPLLRAGARDHVLATRLFDEAGRAEGRNPAWVHTTRADTMFAAWLVGRHARTLTSRPQRLLDTEHCAPARRTIALAEPMLTLGLLAVPARLASGDPIISYNAALLALPLLGALAMFLLVAELSRVPAAGIAAGLLYAFHPVLLRDVTHAFIYDLTWTLFAFFFARRLFAWGRWRDAAGLALSCALQLGASFYPFLAAVFLASPFALWLLVHYRLRHVRPAQLVAVIGAIAATAVVVFAPYLELRGATDLLRRPVQSFASWVTYLPSGSRFPGWPVLALAIGALAAGRERVFGKTGVDPRLALLASGLLVALAAAGGNHNARALARIAGESPPLPLPDLYAMLSALVPGLDSVRGVSNLSIGVHLVLCTLAGLGAAALLRRLPARLATAAGVAIIVVAALDVLRPAALGFEPRLHFDPVGIRPSRSSLAFFERLEALGNTGPVLEVPVVGRAGETAVAPILLSGWHGRRTSACFGSYEPPERARVEELARELPAREAVQELYRLGFTTVLVHERGEAPLHARFDAAASRGDAGLRRLHGSRTVAAYAIEP